MIVLLEFVRIKYAKKFTKTMTEEAYIVYVSPTGKIIITYHASEGNDHKTTVRRIGIRSVNPCVFFLHMYWLEILL